MMHGNGWRICVSLLCCAVFTGRSAPAGEVTAERVQAALAELDTLAERTLQRTGAPGMSIAVVYRDEVIYLKGFGVRRAGEAAPVDADTVFQLASVSKPMASTVIAALVGKGVIGWDDPLTDHDPGFAFSDPWATRAVTIRDMLCHRSGLADHEGDLLEDLGYDRAEVLRRLRYAKPASSFRSRYAYTNFGYTAAAVAAAKSTGTAWEDLAAETLYEPLGMNATSSRFQDYAAAPNRAHLHARVDDEWVARHLRDADAQSPAGGVSSTARDMAQWLRLQLGDGSVDDKRIVAAAALDETHRPQIVSRVPANATTDRAGFYGLGWNVNYDDQGRVRWSHSGAFDLGAATVVSLLPSEEVGVVVLTNAAPRGVPEAISETFFDLVLEGKASRDWASFFEPLFAAALAPPYGSGTDYSHAPKSAAPALPLAAYTGRYHNAYFGDLDIIEGNGTLVLQIGPNRTAFPLRHWNRDLFLYQPVGESAGGLSTVLFSIDAQGRARSVVIENLDINGQGTFTLSPDED